MEISSLLSWPDYLVLVSFLVISLGIGVYHAMTGGRQKTTTEFIMANRSLGVLPTAISMLVSFQSAIMVLGNTAEMYSYGSQHLLMLCFSFTIACLVSERIFVPWMFPLKLISVYEYFELRFDSKALRSLAASLGIVFGILYMGVAIYGPSSALLAVTGMPLYISMPAMSAVAISYTALGGMRAVIWTDVFQFGIMLAGMLAVLIKGIIVVGGMNDVLSTCDNEGRIVWAIWSPDPTVRHTVWGYLIGQSITWTIYYALNQASVQRYCATTSLANARLSILINIPALILMHLIACFTGLIVVAFYAHSGCDPLANQDVENGNQLLAYFVTTLFSSSRGFAGLFLATLYGGALSTVSSSLSGSAANCWEDVLKWKLDYLSESRKALLNRFLVIVFGLMATGMAFVAANVTGPVNQVSTLLLTTINGPLLGMFLLGGLSRIPNWKGVLIGSCAGLFFNIWLVVGAFTISYKYPTLPPLSMDSCHIDGEEANNSTNLTTTTTSFLYDLDINSTKSQFSWNYTSTFEALQPTGQSFTGIQKLYTVSYIWLSTIGCLVTLVVGTLTSLPFRDSEVERHVNNELLISWRQCTNCRLYTPGSVTPYQDRVASCHETELVKT